jgi:ketosteroid isomerase-like protein
MTSITPVAMHGAEYLRMLDAKDEVGIRALLTTTLHVDEITRQWRRGPSAIGAELRALFSRVSDVQSTATDVHVVRWGDVEVETFELHQVYELDGVTTRVVSPTTLIWRRTPDGWRLALIQSIPTASE